LANNATSYVWLTQTGALVAATTLSPPTNARIFLGAVTTLSGAITNIDSSGVVSVKGGRFSRITADIGAPVDSPPPISLLTTTTTGVYLWNGANHALQPQEGVSATILATQTLTAGGPRTFYYKVTAADETVNLPAASALPPGWTVTIYNSPDSTHNVVVKDSTGATTYATVTPGQAVQASTYPGTGGATVWPTGTWTAAAPTGGLGIGGASGAG
jgi:plastocyanin